MIAARVATMRLGDVAVQRQRAADLSAAQPISEITAATMLNVSRDTVRHAKKVIAEGTPEEIDLITRETDRDTP